MDQMQLMNKKTIAIQGDNLKDLKMNSDTSIYIASVMTSKGYKIFWYQPKDLSYVNGRFIAVGNSIAAQYNETGHSQSYHIVEPQLECDLSTVACVMIRQDPPVDMHYIASSHILSLLQEEQPGIFFVNSPDVVRNYVEKFLPVSIARQHSPPTLVSGDFEVIKRFLHQYEQIVVKPIYGFGGKGIEKIMRGQEKKIITYLEQQKDLQVIAQKFLPEVHEGDKRVVVCDGEILEAIKRTPANESFLTNTGMGGTLSKTFLSDKERRICESIARDLKKRDIFFAGIDLIGEFVTEINITSPGLLGALHKEYGFGSVKSFFDKLSAKIIR